MSITSWTIEVAPNGYGIGFRTSGPTLTPSGIAAVISAAGTYLTAAVFGQYLALNQGPPRFSVEPNGGFVSCLPADAATLTGTLRTAIAAGTY